MEAERLPRIVSAGLLLIIGLLLLYAVPISAAEREMRPVTLLLEPPHDSIWREPLSGMEFVWIEGGCYSMGCGDWIGSCEADEVPVHEVCVNGFWMGKYEVTQGQWLKIMGENPSRFQKGDAYPVEQVDWKEVQDFVAFLNGGNKSKNSYRLPTEAEWEYAARSGGKKEKYAGGNNADAAGWAQENSDGSSHPVGKKQPNGLGLYDMTGNVYEWCLDWYTEKYYEKSPQKNPRGPSKGKRRVMRGGAMSSEGKNIRVSNRGRSYPTCPNHIIGFRLVWSASK